MTKTNRRSFLEAGLVLVGSPALPIASGTTSPSSTQEEPLYLYINESGIWHKGPYVTGMLIVQDPRKHLRRIRELRVKHRFYTELRYSSSDIFKVGFARDVINYFVREADLRFAARAMTADTWHYVDGHRPSNSVFYYYNRERLILDNVPRHHELYIQTTSRYTLNSNKLFHAYISKVASQVKKIEIVPLRVNDLLQLAGFLTGNILGDLREPTNKTKRELLAEMLKQLGMERLWGTAVSKKKDFRVELWTAKRTSGK